jgi:hypothetical protein
VRSKAINLEPVASYTTPSWNTISRPLARDTTGGQVLSEPRFLNTRRHGVPQVPSVSCGDAHPSLWYEPRQAIPRSESQKPPT